MTSFTPMRWQIDQKMTQKDCSMTAGTAAGGSLKCGLSDCISSEIKCVFSHVSFTNFSFISQQFNKNTVNIILSPPPRALWVS